MEIYFLPKRRLVLLAVLLCILLVLPFSPRVLYQVKEVVVLLSGRIIPIYHVQTDQKKIAFSFDATWGADNTLRLLDILDKHRIKTTFFLAGFWLQKYPEMVREIHKRGHEIGNHSWTHPHMNSLSPEKIEEELMITHDKIMELTGMRSVLFRPPFGEYSNKVIETAEKCGYKTIIWSVDSLDWQNLSADQMVRRVTRKIHPGAIVLFHNAGKGTPEAIDALFSALIGEGYRIVPISKLLIDGPYYVDHTGMMKPKPMPVEPEPSADKEGN